MESFIITPAEQGGFVVRSDPRDNGYLSTVYFAGDLAASLEWLRVRLLAIVPKQQAALATGADQ